MNEELKWQRMIHAYDFAILEIEMYLDTHPADKAAMKLRHSYRHKRAHLVKEYCQRFGNYTVTVDSVMGEKWTWIDDPWPWE